ncbi:hypothetical protein [Hyphobacterium sp.]|uniref:hypothetical protein n=1 Tax=Hyphobacterium sp. TaxID=2004662 RepID=UPI003749CE5E
MLEKLALGLILANRPGLRDGPARLNEAASLVREAIKTVTGFSDQGRTADFDIALQFKAWNTPTGAEKVVARPLDDRGDYIESFALYKENSDKLIDGDVADRLRKATADLPEAAAIASQGRIKDNFHVYGEYLWQSAVHRVNDQEEEEMLRDLQEISRILAKWNIGLDTDPVKLGLAALMKPAEE